MKLLLCLSAVLAFANAGHLGNLVSAPSQTYLPSQQLVVAPSAPVYHHSAPLVQASSHSFPVYRPSAPLVQPSNVYIQPANHVALAPLIRPSPVYTQPSNVYLPANHEALAPLVRPNPIYVQAAAPAKLISNAQGMHLMRKAVRMIVHLLFAKVFLFRCRKS